MTSDLRNYLVHLHKCLPDNPRPDLALTNAGDIIRCCSYLNTDADIASACSLIFDINNGLVVYLRKCAAIDKYFASKLRILEFLPTFIEKAKKSILKYAVDIKNVCLLIFNCDRKVKIRSAIFDVLVKLFELCAGSEIGEELDTPALIDKLFLELAQQSRLTSTVQQGIYRLLGVLVDTFPEYVGHCSDRILLVYFGQLKKQMTSKTKAPENLIIEGCFDGLTSLLNTFYRPLDEDESKQLFHYVVMAIKHIEDSTRYSIPRCGMQLIHKHASLFPKHLYDNHDVVYNNLCSWLKKSNREMNKLTYLALEALFRQVAVIFCNEISSDNNRDIVQRKFQFFVDKFNWIVNTYNENSNLRWIAVAIKGYGFFAAPCKLLMGIEEVKIMFIEVLRHCEIIFFSESEGIENKIQYLPSFVESLASIISQLDEISEVLLLSLENLLVYLIEHFPLLLAVHHFLCYNAIIKLLINIYPKGASFRPFVAKIVYQGLLRTCSHSILMQLDPENAATVDTETFDENQSENITYKNYMDLWLHLLDAVQQKDLNVLGIPLAERQAVTEILYDEILFSVLSIISKLNFSVTKLGNVSEEASMSFSPMSDPVAGLQASNPKDLQIFVNVVDFCKHLLLAKNIYLFKKWTYKFGYEVISLSSKFPLVSGFYKLLAVCFKICSRSHYFKGIGLEDDFSATKNSSFDSNEQLTCYVLFSKYLHEVVARLQQYKDDLLASCLQLVLSVPTEIVAKNVIVIVPAVTAAFRLGPSYIPIAQEALSALEAWSSHLSVGVLAPLYEQILPLLNSYLKNAASMGTSDIVNILPSKAGSKKKASKAPLKLSKGKIGALDSLPRIVQLKLRIIELLGHLGSSINQRLIDRPEQSASASGVAWDANKHLKFAMPFADMKPDIYLDVFLPNVVNLACSSSDRQTKAAACELLHALVLFMLGSHTSKSVDMQAKQPMTSLYEKILPSILRLACDVDSFVRQLFEPLLMQLIHWFSSSNSNDGKVTYILLKALMDGVGSSTDSALRDLSARCIKEFLVWSMKHSVPKKSRKDHPVNQHVKILLKALYGLALNPDPFLRLGAALIFNNIFAVFREEDDLVQIYIFELLYYFVESLTIAQKDDKHLGTREQCKQALDHIQRILKYKSNALNVKDECRRISAKCKAADLPSSVIWLLEQCGRPESDCRHYCMKLVSELIPHLKNKPSTRQYFQCILKESGPTFFIEKFEGTNRLQSERQYLHASPTLKEHLTSGFSLPLILSWFDVFQAALDCYIWSFGTKDLSPSDIFLENLPSVVLHSVNYFLTDVALSSLPSIASTVTHVASEPHSIYFSPGEIAQYNYAKCTVIIRIMDFVECIAVSSSTNSQIMDFKEELFGKNSFWIVFAHCILRPLSIGFEMCDLEIMENVPKRTFSVLSSLQGSLRNDHFQNLTAIIGGKIRDQDSWNAFDQLLSIGNMGEDFSSLISVCHLMAGYDLLNSCKMLIPCLLNAGLSVGDLVKRLFDAVQRSCTMDRSGTICAVQLTGLQLSLMQKVLMLSFGLGLSMNVLVSFLMDASPLRSAIGHSEISVGSNLMVTFEQEITLHLIRSCPRSVVQLMEWAVKQPIILANILFRMLDHLATDRNLRKRCGAEVTKAILANWEKLRFWWLEKSSEEMKKLTLRLFNKILVIDSTILMTPGPGDNAAFLQVFDMYLTFLVDKTLTLQSKGQILDILPFFLGISQENLNRLREHLVKLFSQHFPLKSSELSVGSVKYKEYVSMFNKLLFALRHSGSLILLEILSELICTEPRHACENEFEMALMSFMKRLPFGSHIAAVQIPLDIFWMESSPTDVRRWALDRIAIPLLQNANKIALLDFFAINIGKIMSILQEKTCRGFGNQLSSQLVSKLGCFKLMEVLYSLSNVHDLHSMQSKVNSAFCDGNPKTGKELTQEITRAGHSAKKEGTGDEGSVGELRRLCRCMAYNALVAVISCTQTEMKFYTGFLFSENVAKGELLWDNLIDNSKTYSFEMELSAPLEKRKQLVSIQREMRELRAGDHLNDDGNSYDLSIHFLTTQNLEASSLSDDVSQFDFTSSSKMSFSITDTNSSVKEESDKEVKPQLPPDYIEMELDEINRHECMASLNALLGHLDASVSKASQSGDATEMPSWMANLHKKMIDSSTQKNVRIFIAKLIVNNENVFKPCAKHWLYPLMQLLISGAAGNSMNYFMTDVLVVLMSWHTTAIPEDTLTERSLASRLLEFLMQNAAHPTKEILRHNLELIKMLVECWKDRLEIPTKVIYDRFCNPNTDKFDNVVGIQLLGIVLSKDLPPFSTSMAGGLSEEIFLKTFAQNLNFKYKDVYHSAAEVTGMCLNHLSEREKSNDFPFHALVKSQLFQMASSQLDRFIDCLHAIRSSYPPIVDSYWKKILFILPKLHGVILVQALEILLSRLDSIPNVYQELKSIDFCSILKNGNERIQTICLQILNKILCHMNVEQVSELLPFILPFVSQPGNAKGRNVTFEILSWIYDNFVDDGTPNAVRVISGTKPALIQCLADEDFLLRLKALNFWSHESRMPVSTLDRSIELIKNLYSSSSEHHFLGYATYLLMELTSKSPDYNRHIFDHPLSDCKFEDYNINSSWRAQHSTMVPLFLETQASGSFSMDALHDPSKGSSLPSSVRQLRATQEKLQFTPTQNQDLSKPYNWLTQSTLDTSFTAFGEEEGESTTSSLMFNRKSDRNKWQKPAGSDFGKRRLKMDEADNSSSTDAQDKLDLVHLRRRFFKDKSQSSDAFARMNARIKQNREIKMRERKLAREAQVTVYRQYRKGDLPDIQISYAAIIAPLQALAQRDSSIAKILFTSLFTSILEEASRLKSQDEFGIVIHSTLTSLNTVLEKTTLYNQHFISAVQEICYSNNLLKINAENLTSASRMSFQQNMGILLLERAILEGADQNAPRPSKIARLHKSKSTTDDKPMWIKLAELNKSLNNYDVVNGIFMHKVAAEQELREALEAEAQGDFYSALRSYQKAFSSESQVHQHGDAMLDADLWNGCTLQCFERLNNWEKMCSVALRSIDDSSQPDINSVWEDFTNQEQYLPYFIHGKLKLILRGSDEQPFINFLDGTLNEVDHPERRQFLEGRFSEELAVLSIVQKDYDRADHYRSACINGFLEDWSALSDLVPIHQKARLCNLQKLVEMGDFLRAIRETTTNFEAGIKRLLNKWEKSFVDKFTDVHVLNDIYINRNLYIKHLESHLMQQPASVQENARTMLHQCSIRNQLLLVMTCVEAAGCQNNVTVALSHLKDSFKLSTKLDDPILMSKWYYLYCRTHQLNAKKQDSSKKIGTLFNVWKNLDKDIACKTTQECAGLKSENLLLQSRNADLLSGFLDEDQNLLDHCQVDQLEDLVRRINCKPNDLRQIKTSLTNYSYGKLKDSVSLEYDSDSEMNSMANAHLQLAKFCDRSLREYEEKTQADQSVEFATVIVKNLLGASKCGSEEATRLFPRLLQLVEMYPDTSETFSRTVSAIPCWMFIPWIAQLVALLDKSQSMAIQGLVLRIAQEYPNALIYPFNVSRKGYSFSNSNEGRQKKLFVKKIQALLSKLWLVEHFALALEQLTSPVGTFVDAMSEIARLLKADKKKCHDIYSNMYHSLFIDPFDENAVVPHGQFRKSFAKSMKKTFHDNFGNEGTALDTMDSQHLGAIVTAITKKAKSSKHPSLIKDYTEWLSEFRQSSYSMELEIPGQYGKFKKPMPEYHTKVARFHSEVLTLDSVRRPKRIVIYGDNNKEYKFLVKAGEDLRGDQRIEQLFVIMNEVYARDPACRLRQLKMVTYEIIPLNDALGLLEWVPNAEPLKEFMEHSLTETEKKELGRAEATLQEWVKKPSNGDGTLEFMYESVYKAYDRKASVAKFEEVVLLSPRNLLKNAFFKMSASTEAFFTLRNLFIVSYAVASVSQYILGIGDRHLSNFMVSHDTGSIVTIDFGHAFGSATSFLPVPELMPMRLTPQLLNLMEPMREHGLFERTMSHALSALRSNADILSNTMDVFISEPSLDWINLARKQFAVIGKQGDERDLDWYPRQRVDFAKRKLSGDNSSAIMLDELELGQKRKKGFPYFKKVCAGEKDSVRARLPAKRLSVEKQVSCLLDHATDPHILAKTYCGWKAFL